MKKIIPVIVSLLLVFIITGCKSKPPQAELNLFPDSIRTAVINAPGDILVGVGTANLSSLAQSRTISTNRARAEIARQMNSMVEDMIRDYQASSEVDPRAALAFQENITVTLSAADVSGARVV